jgi:hypothetical protein
MLNVGFPPTFLKTGQAAYGPATPYTEWPLAKLQARERTGGNPPVAEIQPETRPTRRIGVLYPRRDKVEQVAGCVAALTAGGRKA